MDIHVSEAILGILQSTYPTAPGNFLLIEYMVYKLTLDGTIERSKAFCIFPLQNIINFVEHVSNLSISREYTTSLIKYNANRNSYAEGKKKAKKVHASEFEFDISNLDTITWPTHNLTKIIGCNALSMMLLRSEYMMIQFKVALL